MKKVMLFFAAAVLALGANAQGEKKETKKETTGAKKEISPAKKASAKKEEKAPIKKEAKKDAPKS